MKLPAIDEDFLPVDDQAWSEEARRLRDFLRLVDDHFAADSSLLQSRIRFDPHLFGIRLNQAVQASMVTDWTKGQLAEILEELFVDEKELEAVRSATTALGT